MLLPCTSCRRHVRETNVACPFCGHRARDPRRAIASTFAVSLALAGCGGREEAPPPPPQPTTSVSAPSATAPPTESELPSGVLPPSAPEEVSPPTTSDETASAEDAEASTRRRRAPTEGETEAERALREAEEAQVARVDEALRMALETGAATSTAADLGDGVATGLGNVDEIVRAANGYGGPPITYGPGTGTE